MSRDSLVLLHGLGESSLSMTSLHAYGSQAGYAIHNYDYPYRELSIDRLVNEWMPATFASLQTKGTVHFITHSLGGILVRAYLEKYSLPNLGRVVMMAPPHKGSPIFNIYRHNFFFSQLMGPPADECGTDERSYMRRLSHKVAFPLGVIAGNVAYDSLSFCVMSWPHDGRLPVDNTKIEGMSDHVVIPAGHELMPANPLAVWQSLHFIRYGAFARLPQGMRGLFKMMNA